MIEAKYILSTGGILSVAPPGTEANIASAWFYSVNISDPPLAIHGIIEIQMTLHTESFVFDTPKPDVSLVGACISSTQSREIFALKIEV